MCFHNQPRSNLCLANHKLRSNGVELQPENGGEGGGFHSQAD
jgi:hypothetical protein